MSSEVMESFLSQCGVNDNASSDMRFQGAAVTAYYSVDRVELARRADFSGAPICDQALLQALYHLPLAVTVPAPFIETDAWPALFTADPCFVTVDVEGFTRIANPPCRVHAFALVGDVWSSISSVLSGLLPIAPCLVIGGSEPADKLQVQASYFGFGLATHESIAVPPPKMGTRAESWRAWEFGERLVSELG